MGERNLEPFCSIVCGLIWPIVWKAETQIYKEQLANQMQCCTTSNSWSKKKKMENDTVIRSKIGLILGKMMSIIYPSLSLFCFQNIVQSCHSTWAKNLRSVEGDYSEAIYPFKFISVTIVAWCLLHILNRCIP